jgi:hypothetical protein
MVSLTFDTHDHGFDDLATKRDLKEMEFKLELKIAKNKSELIRWVVGVALLQITIIVGLVFRLAGKL